MKKSLYNIGMLAVAACAFIACEKEVEVNSESKVVTHVATVTLDKADITKTAVVEGVSEASYVWTTGDEAYLHVYENGTEGTITNFALSSGNTVATLTVSFEGTPEAPYTYTAKYAKTISGGGNPKVQESQAPTATSFDPAADIMVSKATNDVTNVATRSTELTFTMGRVVSVNKMTLTGLVEGESVSKVEFTLGSSFLGGYYTGSSYGSTVKTLTATYEPPITVGANGTFPVYFTCAPVDAASITSVVVTTDQNVYTKSSSLDPNPFDGKTITFAVGTMKRFNMAMGGYGKPISTGTDYTLVESQSDLYDGATYIIVGNADDLVAMGTQNGNNRASVGVTASSKVINIDNTIAAATFTIEKVSKGYTILDNSTSKYLYTGSTSSNRLQSTDTANDNATWNISISDGVATITNVGNTSRGVMCLNGNLFNCYASLGSYKTLSLYVDLDTCIPTLATPSILAEVQNTNKIYVTWSEVDNANSYTVTCTGQEDQNIAAGVGEATFTALADGTYTVTVTAISNDHSSYLDSQAATVENLVIGSPKGSSSNPYTVAEALAAAGELATGGQSDDEVYISGIVSTVSSYNSTYKSITYYISDDGTTTEQFEVYSGKGLNGADFSAITDLAVGDEVTVKGYLKNFNGTLEVYQSSQIVAINYATRYTITVNSATNGTITASAASAGEQGLITLTATPNSGYELDEWIVKDASDNDVTVTNNQFTMPASNVTVSASFKTASGKTYTILWNSTNNSKGNSSYTDTWTVTSNGLTCNMANWNNNNNGWTNSSGNGQIKCGRRNNASVATITTSTALSEAIKTVTITIDALTADKINSIKLYSSSNNSTWTEEGSFTKATGDQSVTISSPTSSKYYKLEFDCASGSSNGLLTLSKLVLTTN